jgi:hypothetical protein
MTRPKGTQTSGDPAHQTGLDKWADRPARKAEHERRAALAVAHAEFIALITAGKLPMPAPQPKPAPAPEPAIVTTLDPVNHYRTNCGTAAHTRVARIFGPPKVRNRAGKPAEIEYPAQLNGSNDPLFNKDMNKLDRAAWTDLREYLDAQQARKDRAVAWQATKAARAAKRDSLIAAGLPLPPPRPPSPGLKARKARKEAKRAARQAALALRWGEPITGVMAITEAPDALRSYINEGARVRMRRYRAKKAGKRVAPYHDGRRRMTQSGPADANNEVTGPA